MKNLKTIALFVLITISTSIYAQNKTINVTKSSLNWVGKKVTGEHKGTIKVKSGALAFNKDILVGGTVVVDMKSINTTDLQGEMKSKLDTHLKSDDFFGTDKFPIAVLTFKKVTPNGKDLYIVEANLKVKGVSNIITFDLKTNATSATASLIIDRTKFGIKYGSGSFMDNLGDKAISNEFNLNVSLEY